MKKSLLLLLSLTSVVTIYGCSKAPAEKESVIVADKVAESTMAPASAATDGDNTVNLDSIGNGEEAASNGTNTAGNSDISDKDNTSGNLGASENVDALLNPPGETSAQDNTNAGVETNTEVETKKLTLSIEGTQEEYTGSVFHSKLGYQITYDIDRFSPSITEDGADYFMADNSDPELYPYTYVRITRYDKPVSDNTTQNDPPTFVKYDIDNITGYVTTEFIGDVTIGDYNAKLYHFASGKDWNSTTNNIYLIEHGDYIYEIQTQTFIEAEEGYGARIQAMLDTFTFE